MNYKGLAVIVNDNLREYVLEERLWSERLFTRPWKPWRKYRQALKHPAPFYVNESSHTIYTTTEGADTIRRAIKAEVFG